MRQSPEGVLPDSVFYVQHVLSQYFPKCGSPHAYDAKVVKSVTIALNCLSLKNTGSLVYRTQNMVN